MMNQNKNPKVEMCTIVDKTVDNKTMGTIVNKDEHMTTTEESKTSTNPNQAKADSQSKGKIMCVIVPEKDKHTSSAETKPTPVTNNIDTVTEHRHEQPIANGHTYAMPVRNNVPIATMPGYQPNPQNDIKLPVGENLVSLQSVINNDESQHNIMRAFIKDVAVKVRDGRIYVYNGRFYEECGADDIKRLLLKLYRKKLCGKRVCVVI